MGKNAKVINEIIDQCEAYSFTKAETHVICLLSGSTDAAKQYGNTSASYQKTLEILSQYKTFAEVVKQIEEELGFDTGDLTE